MRAPSLFLQPVIALTLEAGRRILEIYQTDFRIAYKEDRSPFTAADLVSHHCLIEGLQALTPSWPVLSEEFCQIAHEERSAWKTYWLIDPLDGTREFIKRNGEFTVNVSLIHQHQPVFGVVYAPAFKTCYFASEGLGAFKQVGEEEPQPIHVRQQAPRNPTLAGSRSHKTQALNHYLSRLGPHDLIASGSSLKLCWVAEGLCDLYPRIGPTYEWDTAASQCIIEAAGGRLTNLSGQMLRYNTKDSLLNPYFLAFGDTSKCWWSYAKDISESIEEHE